MIKPLFNRKWAMPASDTFDCEPIGDFVKRYLSDSICSVDPFSRNKKWATHTNDLNPNTSADHHLDAEDFLSRLSAKSIKADLIILDPPYSPRQISECYALSGIKVTMKDTQNAALYKRVRDAVFTIASPNAIVLSFGWNSSGMGITRGFEIIEILMVCHGGAHNDTICIAECRMVEPA